MNTESNSLANRIRQELAQHNDIIGQKIDEIMQAVLADPKISSRTDWSQIQQTLKCIISSLEPETGESTAEEIETGQNSTEATNPFVIHDRW